MFRKIIITILIPIIISPTVYAKDFSINYEEKAAYVNMDFWSNFGDSILCGYIQEALKNNHDAKKMSYQVEEFKQKIRYTRSFEFPMLSVAPSYLAAQVPDLDNFELDASGFLLPFSMNYEADLLLKNHDKTKLDKKSCEIKQLEEKTAYITLVSNLAAIYVNIMRYNKKLELEEKILHNQQQLLSKTELRYRYGIASKIDVNNMHEKIYATQNNIKQLSLNRRDALFELAVLLGKNPECINDLQITNIENFGNNLSVPDSIPSEKIFSRPDILAAEKDLERANIDIRIARKEFFPSFKITGFWVFNTIAPGNFFNWNTILASILAGATQDIFVGGRKVANLKIKKMKYEQLFQIYEQTNLTALKEVSSTLLKLEDDEKILNIFCRKSSKEYDNLQLTNLNYRHGTVSQMDFLSKENDFYKVRQEVFDKKAEKLIDYISLYKALGGNL